MTDNVIISTIIRHIWSGTILTYVKTVKRQLSSGQNWRIVPVLYANSRITGWHLDRLLEDTRLAQDTPSRTSTVSLLLERIVITVHRHEKRHGRKLDKRAFGCAIARSTPDHIRQWEPPQLMFELTWQFCLFCNMPHWILGEEIDEDEIPKFNPNDYLTSELAEMGFFKQFDDADGK
jgi:hypothetical protein